MKTLKQIREENLNEKKADFLRLTFANNQTVKKVDRWIYKNLSHANPGYMSMIPDEHGKSIEWEDMDDADGLMKKLKKAGFKFKVDMREGKKTQEVTGDKEAYQKFFKSMLKKFGVTEPDQLKGADRKKFYDAIDAGWEGDNEED
jgi:hypothetical protein